MSKSIRKANAVSATSKGAALASAASLSFFVSVSRPTAGDSLRGFTLAWMTLGGLFAGKSMPRPYVQALAGKSMVSNHLGNGNLCINTKGEVELTAKGIAHFGARGAQSGIMANAEGWRVILSTGKADGSLVRNAKDIQPIAALLA